MLGLTKDKKPMKVEQVMENSEGQEIFNEFKDSNDIVHGCTV